MEDKNIQIESETVKKQGNLHFLIAIVIAVLSLVIGVIALIIGCKGGADDNEATPTIEISEDGYWVINGEKTDVKAEGKDGADGKDGEDGKDGADGAPGKDGEDGKNLTDDNPQELLFYLTDEGNYAVSVGNVLFLSHIDIPSTYKGKPVTKIVEARGHTNVNAIINIKSISIPNSVTSIDHYVFSRCSSLTSVEIGDGVTSIGNCAFQYCTSLASVVIGDSVTSIGYDAFYCCSSLTSVVIGDSVTNIGASAFGYCTSLADVYYTGTEAEWRRISIGFGNDALKNATIHYNYVPEN